MCTIGQLTQGYLQQIHSPHSSACYQQNNKIPGALLHTREKCKKAWFLQKH